MNKLIIIKQKKCINIKLLEFEKDKDDNWHIDFVMSSANCRSMNYDIDLVDKYHCKKIAGKIIPALSTTTSIIIGFATIELLKYY